MVDLNLLSFAKPVFIGIDAGGGDDLTAITAPDCRIEGKLDIYFVNNRLFRKMQRDAAKVWRRMRKRHLFRDHRKSRGFARHVRRVKAASRC